MINLEKIKEEYEDLAEEGLEIMGKIIHAIGNILMSILVNVIMVIFACIGWLKRRLAFLYNLLVTWKKGISSRFGNI